MYMYMYMLFSLECRINSFNDIVVFPLLIFLQESVVTSAMENFAQIQV